MAYEIVRKRLSEIVPFNTLLGIEIQHIGDGEASARVELRPELLNHIKTAHAGAIFALAEAASGAAMSGAFLPAIATVRPVASGARIDYLKAARTALTARARTAETPAVLRERLAKDGKAEFEVLVEVCDELGNIISQVAVTWHLAKRER